jgi:uracil-DNA glycosylase
MKEVMLDSLRNEMLSAELPLKETANNLVFGEGSPDADIVFIGEAPGKNEDLEGRPFVGSAGRILDRLLVSAGIKREDVFITSIVKYRPPGNRNPTIAELKSHSHYLVEQLKIIRPKVIVTMGNFSTKFVLGGFDVQEGRVPGISKIRGKTHNVQLADKTITVFPTYHPAATLYNPGLREIIERDFAALRSFHV